MSAQQPFATQQPTRIYTVFFTQGWGWGGSHPPESVISNEQVLRSLQSRCDGVEFVVRDVTEPDVTPESVANEIEAEKQRFDGVLTFGGVRGDDRVVLSGLPTVVVNNLFEFNSIPYPLYREGAKVLTSSISRLDVVSPALAASMLDDLVEKINLIQVLRKMKESTVLAVIDGRLRYYPMPEDASDVMDTAEDNEFYCGRLEEALGVKTIIIGSEELARQIEEIEDQEAEQIARMWIEEAEGWFRDATEGDVADGAKMYLALDRLKEEYHATAILTDTASFLKSFKICACLASMEFHKRGIVCTDQPNTGPLVAQLMGLYLTGRPSFNADLIVDPGSGTSVLVHCGAPINPHGNDRVPYLIRDYRMGADVLAELPVDEPVTIWRVNVINSEVLLHTGQAVAFSSAYQGPVGLNDILCGTKLVASVDAEKVQGHLNPQRDGVHRAAIYGDYRQEFADLATLIGFELVEEDR